MLDATMGAKRVQALQYLNKKKETFRVDPACLANLPANLRNKEVKGRWCYNQEQLLVRKSRKRRGFRACNGSF